MAKLKTTMVTASYVMMTDGAAVMTHEDDGLRMLTMMMMTALTVLLTVLTAAAA